jgi:hypothetical protein
MNLPNEQNQEKSETHTSALISLFKKKGYECEKINSDKDTIYVMKYEFSQQQKPFEPKPKITIH